MPFGTLFSLGDDVVNINELLEKYPYPKSQTFIRDFFSNIPKSYEQYLQNKNFSTNDIVISSYTSSKTVLFLMNGRFHAIEDKIQKLPYKFIDLYPVEIVGDYELFTHADYSYATIIAAEPSECIIMPANLYISWISKNANALFLRTQLLMQQLSTQTAANRQYFHMDYTTRCISTLLQECKVNECISSTWILSINREDLAGKIGCSLRTCHRIIQELVQKKMISILKGKILITQTQQAKLYLSVKENELN